MFKMPITREATANCDMTVPNHALRLMSLRAVIVDDSAEFLRVARSMLEREGITVVDSAQTGAEALRSAQEHDPDVVLLDVGLGEESGFDVAERLSQASGARVRVILISAGSEQDLSEFIDASPAIGFVPKALLSADTITDLLDGSPSS
jgi:CheY-like chemotaxis protein